MENNKNNAQVKVDLDFLLLVYEPRNQFFQS